MIIARLLLVAMFLISCPLGKECVMAEADSVKVSAENRGLKVGTMAPDFTAKTYMGNKVVLSDIYKKGPVVLIFYRGTWCPFCNLHLKAFQSRLKDFEKFGATILAVSVDKPDSEAKIVKDNSLGFEVISDTQAEILKAYKVVYQVPDGLVQRYRSEYKIDLETYSGRKDNVIAVPATYVIDKAGKIIFAYANEDYQLRTHPQEVLDVLERLRQGIWRVAR